MRRLWFLFLFLLAGCGGSGLSLPTGPTTAATPPTLPTVAIPTAASTPMARALVPGSPTVNVQASFAPSPIVTPSPAEPSPPSLSPAASPPAGTADATTKPALPPIVTLPPAAPAPTTPPSPVPVVIVATASTASTTTANPGSAAGTGTMCPTGYPVKGIEASKIYHVAGQRDYATLAARTCFATEAAAQAAGYRKSQT